MIVQTMFEPLRVRSAAGFSVVRTKELQAFLRRLYNAESGFDYSVRREIPRIQASRDQHMLNAQKLRDEIASLRASAIEARSAETGNTDSVHESAVPQGDAQ